MAGIQCDGVGDSDHSNWKHMECKTAPMKGNRWSGRANGTRRDWWFNTNISVGEIVAL